MVSDARYNRGIRKKSTTILRGGNDDLKYFWYVVVIQEERDLTLDSDVEKVDDLTMDKKLW